MSLILEALKKSEQQRRLGEAPNLGTPIVLARRRRNLLPVLAAAIAVALGAGWYLLRDKPGSTPDEVAVSRAAQTPPATDGAARPAPSPRPAARPAAPKPIAVATPPPRAPSARKGTAVEEGAAPVIAPPVLPVTPPAHDRPGSVTPPPVASPAAPQVASAAKAAGAGKPHDRPEPSGPASPLDRGMAPTAATGAGQPHDRPPPAGPASPLEQVSKTAAPPAVATASPPPAVRKPALPSVWELPYSTRKDLPEIDLTMHVYSSTPADRFVVVKGERHVEGDQIADGVTLKEITADGMILAFKGQDFTFPRDSR